jgi:hypothetical protein
MSEETSLDPQKFDIELQQIVAAILDHQGSITVPISSLFKDFKGRAVGLTQDNDNMSVTLFLSGETMTLEDAQGANMDSELESLPTYEEFSQKSE